MTSDFSVFFVSLGTAIVASMPERARLQNTVVVAANKGDVAGYLAAMEKITAKYHIDDFGVAWQNFARKFNRQHRIKFNPQRKRFECQ